ncbi:MAG: protein kinase, partial [Pseudomonadota bacterium]
SRKLRPTDSRAEAKAPADQGSGNTRWKEPSVVDTGEGTEVPQLTSSNLATGMVIAGRYEVVRQLGAGGMGRVYLARDRELKRDVAIKILREAMSKTEHAKEISKRFEMEAVLPAGISHPNIVTIFDKGEHEGSSYFVMEYLEGSESMGDMLRRCHTEKKFPNLVEVKEYFKQAAEGLLEIHSHDGVWHRDIKTDNFIIFRRRSGQLGLKILDFGIVHAPDAELTSTSIYLGTPSYIAPESFQFDDNDRRLGLDKRADLFALGVALYSCLTLRKPYPQIKDTLSAMEVYRRKDTLPQRPSEIRPDLPAAWDYPTLKLLERDRDKRYQDAHEFLKDLTSNESLPTSPEPSIHLTGALPSEPLASERLNANLKSEKSISVALELTGMKDEKSVIAMPQPAEEKVPTWRVDQQSQEAAESQQRTKKLVGLVGLGVVALVFVGWLLTDALGSMSQKDKNKKKPATSGWMDDNQKASEIERWAEEIEKQKEKPLVGYKPATPVNTTPQAAYPEPEKPRGGVSGLAPDSARRAEARNKKKPAGATPTNDRPADNAQPYGDYAAIYGSGAAMNTGALVLPTDQGAGAPGAPSETRGLTLGVKLVGDIASQPTNAPVVGRVIKNLTLAGKKIPAGSEVHGVATGSSGTRILVNFSFIRLADSTTIPIVGVAKDTGGRLGIPGKKNADLGTASSVIADTASAVGSEAGNRLAGVVDDTIGQAGVRSATGSAARKSERLDNSENVVISRSGTRFVVYLTK